MRKSLITPATIAALGLALLWGAAPARGDTVWLTTGSATYNIGRAPNFGGDFDHLFIGGLNGSVDLQLNVPQVVSIETFQYEEGANRWDAATLLGVTTPRALTVDGSTITFTQGYSVDISNHDVFHLSDGPTLRYPTADHRYVVEITPLGQTMNCYDPATTTGKLQAEMVLVAPAPAAAWAGLALLAGLGVLRWSRRRAA